MISREEASEYDTIDDIIKAIYDSIGSCAECEYYRIADEIDEGYEVCNNLGDDYINVTKDWFCADFKRKD